jgi:plastocyanin
LRLRAARLAAFAGLLLFIALASTAAAANASVEIALFAFDPPTVTINAGEIVTWTNHDQAAHSAAFVNSGPKTPVLSNGKSASLTFTTAGTFDYVCGIHGAAMMGTVIVRAAATQPPTLAPTLAPTPVPTSRTVTPTVAPTVESTSTPTPAPTASPAPTSVAPSTTAASSVVAAVPTEQAPAPAAANDGGPSPLVIGGAVIAVIALSGAVLTRIRR